jgi:DNA-binding NtrC family response regulator
MKVLLVDDQRDVLEALRLLFKAERIDTVFAEGPASALAALEAQDVDAVLMDLNFARDTTSGAEGLDLVSRVRAVDAGLPVIVMTAWGSIEGAVEAMRRGARDYVLKPWDNVRLLATMKAQLELREALRRADRLEREGARHRRSALPTFVAESRAMQPVLKLIERIGPSDANVLVTGEHGTGKEVVARLLHESSNRRERSFVPVNAGGLPEGVFESELFGHLRGAFTDAKSERTGCFELADGGTLFLDEVANMPLSQQAKLLRALQTGEFTPVGSSRVRKAAVRVVSAANVDVTAEVAAGRFREDLLYRLNTVEIRLPPLRERPEDLPHLAAHFLRLHAAHYGACAPRLSEDALRALREHPWPGNVRELGHAIERALLLAQGGVIARDDLGLRRKDSDRAPPIESMTLEGAERYLVARALERFGGNVSEAARSLGLSRSALYRRLQAFGIKTAS